MNAKQGAMRNKIIALLGSGANHTEIANTLGCSTKTVQRVAGSIKSDLAEVRGYLAEYQRLFREQVPIKDRVEIYKRIAEKADTNPFAAMRAVERIDDLDGILTEKDKLKKPQEDSGEHKPIFILPPGTNVQVNVNQQVPGGDQAINIMPETPGGDQGAIPGRIESNNG